MCTRGFAIILLIVTLLHPNSCPADSGPVAEMAEERIPVTYSQEKHTKIYASLHQVLDLTSQEALVRFHDFFGKSPVNIQPFYHLGAYSKNQISQLGTVLAEHVGAKISNGAVARSNSDKKGVPPQWIRGNLQEIDGFLRVQIIGSNFLGEQRSCVINFEMSETLYRALHTALDPLRR